MADRAGETNSGIMDAFEIDFSDLVLASSSSSTPEESQAIYRKVTETLGPGGPGLLAVTGVPNAAKISGKLLPLARKLAILDADQRRQVLKEHNLGTDVPMKDPDRKVSSFATQLNYAGLRSSSKPSCSSNENNRITVGCPDFYTDNASRNDEFEQLGDNFRELGFCMMDLGLRLARVCDKTIGGNELENSILESCSAKGRLIHYHSTLDGYALKMAVNARGAAKRSTPVHPPPPYQWTESKGKIPNSGSAKENVVPESNLWQQWHYDYGIFTVLTAPIFLLHGCSAVEDKPKLNESLSECDFPGDHTCLQILDPVNQKILAVRTPHRSFIIQVGEAAEILSKGKLSSTIHSVYRPLEKENLSRETFVVFLQPAWSKVLSLSKFCSEAEHPSLEENKFDDSSGDMEHITSASDSRYNNTVNEIQKMVPPLSSRMQDGMTFAEFSRETTKQYYGGKGLQSNK